MRGIRLEDLGVLGGPYAPIPIPLEKPKRYQKSLFHFGNIVCRTSDGRIGIITNIQRYNGGFIYTVQTPVNGTYSARVSDLLDPSQANTPRTYEIEWLRKGNAFLCAKDF